MKQRYLLQLEAEPHKPGEPDTAVRLRQWLKLGLRAFGLRAVSIIEAGEQVSLSPVDRMEDK